MEKSGISSEVWGILPKVTALCWRLRESGEQSTQAAPSELPDTSLCKCLLEL